MKYLFRLLPLIIMVQISCKTHKEALKDHQITKEESKNEIEEIAEQENIQPMSLADASWIDDIARQKADLTCEKQTMNKIFEKGEKVDSEKIAQIDKQLDGLKEKEAKIKNDPTKTQYFEEKFAEFLKGCSN